VSLFAITCSLSGLTADKTRSSESASGIAAFFIFIFFPPHENPAGNPRLCRHKNPIAAL
jgi:hypothetical protein